MPNITDKRIDELIAAQDIGDSDLFVIEQGGAAKKALGSVVKEAIGGSSLPSGGTAGQVLTKTSSGAAWSDAGTPTQAQTNAALADYLDEHPEAVTNIPDRIKQALLACFQKVAWVDANGQTYYQNLYNALMNKEVLSIAAVFTQGSAVIYDTDSLDTLRQYLTVTALYDDGTKGVITGYELSGTLAEGTSTITVTYGGKNTTFDVVVTQKMTLTLSDGDFSIQAGAISWNSTHDIYTNMSNDSLRGRKNIYINEGVKPYNTTADDSTFFVTNPPQYPIPIPANATGVTYSIVPNTQFMGVAFYSYDERTGKYTRAEDIGWKQGTYTVNFTAGQYHYLTSAFKYNSNGITYPTEPTEVTIQFLTN